MTGPVVLSETQVQRRLRIADVKACLDKGLAAEAGQPPTVVPRQRIPLPSGTFQWLAAARPDGIVGAKLYTTIDTPDGERRSSLLVAFDSHTGERIAVVESYHLSLMRTAAVTALATRYLAAADAGTLGIIGTGPTAIPQASAVFSERPFRHMLLYSRTASRRERMAATLRDRYGLPASAADRVEDVVAAADVLITATDSATPVLRREWLRPGMLVNAIGSNYPTKREIPASAIAAADRVVVDALPSARTEAGDLMMAAAEGHLDWSTVRELADIIRGGAPQPVPTGWTIFKSVGVAAQDLLLVKLLVGQRGQP